MPEHAPDLPPAPDLPDALARARRTRVVVIGGGVAGLTAALEWAKVGAHVTVLEAADRFGGGVETAELDGIRVDLLADTIPDAAATGTPLGALIDELRLRGELEPAHPHPLWVAAPAIGRGGAAPLPEAAILGIPANPWADDVRRVIGWRGAWRAYLDRLRPPLTIGIERSLGTLVRRRMGDRVTDLLVAPVTRARYGLDPDGIDVEVAAPGLSTALTRTGSLSGAVSALLPDAAPTDAPGRLTFRSGLSTLIDALVARLGDLGAELRPGSAVDSLTRRADDTWVVEVAGDLDEPVVASADADAALVADVVIVATEAGAARTLLGAADVALDAAPAPAGRRDVVTLVVDGAQLADAPRGRAVYPAAPEGEPTPSAAWVEQPSAEWPRLADDAARHGRQVLRVALPDDAARTDAQTTALAGAAAAVLLGVEVGTVHAAARRTADLPVPASALGHAERTAAVRAAVARRPGLVVVGAWLSGSGVAQVVADAVAEVDRARSGVLWATQAPSGEREDDAR